VPRFFNRVRKMQSECKDKGSSRDAAELPHGNRSDSCSSSQGTASENMLSSCLIGSPTRTHDRVEDILSSGNYSVQMSLEPPSKIMGMLVRLKQDVKALKASHLTRHLQPSSNDKQPRKPKPVITPNRMTPARDKLNEIEIMLLEADESLVWLKDRLSKVNTENPV
jgi:hypothetical protein